MPDLTLNLSGLAQRPTYSREHSSAIPLRSRRSSAPITPAQLEADDYFGNVNNRRASEGERRRSSTSALFNAFRRPSLARYVVNALYPPDEQLVEPFSFVSTKTSWAPGIKLMVGLLGQAGYTFGGILICDSLYQTPGPPNLAPGVGSFRPPGPDGRLAYPPPSVAVGAVVFSVGICLGFASCFMFLADGLKIAGNRRKAFTYAGMHVVGIILISMSKFIVVWRKNHTPTMSLIALSLPSGLGRGIHFVTIPRSFSNSEVARNRDFAPLTFEQRQQLSEGLRILAAVFFGLWAGSWAVQDFDPLEREGWGILASLTLNVSAALPNTNLRRADIFRRSQQSLVSPALQSFRIGSPPLPSPTVTSPSIRRPPLPQLATYPLGMPRVPPSSILRGKPGEPSRTSILASMPMSRDGTASGSGGPSWSMMSRSQTAGHGSKESRFTDTTDPLQRNDE